jgi:hypothetical protein
MTTFPARAGRVAGHAYNLAQQIDWAEVARIVGHGLIAFAVIVYMAGHALGTAVHKANDWLAARWVALLVRSVDETAESSTVPQNVSKAPANLEQAEPAIQATAPIVEQAPPAVAPLFEDLAHLSVRQLRELTGVRSKRFRRAELLAMVAA